MLDHILRPLLNERDFITEIYHINGMGEDGGVMYAEMKVRSAFYNLLVIVRFR